MRRESSPGLVTGVSGLGGAPPAGRLAPRWSSRSSSVHRWPLPGPVDGSADADDVRRLPLGLPQVEEIDSDGFDRRVAGKGLVWSYPGRALGRPRVVRTDIAVLYVGDEAGKQALLLGEPRLFFTAPGYDG